MLSFKKIVLIIKSINIQIKKKHQSELVVPIGASAKNIYGIRSTLSISFKFIIWTKLKLVNSKQTLKK